MLEVIWHGTSKRDLISFPASAREDAGYAIWKIQCGKEPNDWKPMRAVGSSVREIRLFDAAGAFRIIYVVTRGSELHILHAFQKKTEMTELRDLQLARKRFNTIGRK